MLPTDVTDRLLSTSTDFLVVKEAHNIMGKEKCDNIKTQETQPYIIIEKHQNISQQGKIGIYPISQPKSVPKQRLETN